MGRSYFHLHLVSDSTGETLINVGRAAVAQYEGISTIEHVYPLVRSETQLGRVLSEIEAAPGLILYTLVDQTLINRLEDAAKTIGVPLLNVLEPVHQILQAYLGTSSTARPGAQHMLNAEYFRRIDAMNFTLNHDDGNLPDNIDEADVILVGVSRTSKTPTSIYLANRGLKTANMPLVQSLPIPESLLNAKKPLIVGLIASPERIVQIRQNRLLTLKADKGAMYVDFENVSNEIVRSRRLCATHHWPMIDVTRRSIEETAAAILDLHREHRLKFIAS